MSFSSNASARRPPLVALTPHIVLQVISPSIGKFVFFHFLTCARGAPRGIVVEFTAVSPEKALGQTLGQKGICQPRPGECRARDAVFCGLMRCPAVSRGKPGMLHTVGVTGPSPVAPTISKRGVPRISADSTIPVQNGPTAGRRQKEETLKQRVTAISDS